MLESRISFFFMQVRNYSEEAAERSEPAHRCELAGVSVCLYQGDAVADMAKLLPRLDYGGSPHVFSPKYIIIYFYNLPIQKNNNIFLYSIFEWVRHNGCLVAQQLHDRGDPGDA